MFDSHESWIFQLKYYYHNVGFTIFKYLIASGYDIFQKWWYLYSWFERPYFTNHIWGFVGL